MPVATHTRSIVLLLLTMVVWGSTFVVTKELIRFWPPFTLAFVRVAIGSLVLLPLALTRHRRDVRLPWPTILFMGLIGVALYYITFNIAMLYTSASQGALVQSCIPAMTALVAVVWLRERASSLRWVGIALSVIGVMIVFSGNVSSDDTAGGSSAALFGNLLMFASVVCWALYTSLAKRVADFDSIVITVCVTGSGALMLLPLAGYEVATDGLQPLPLMSWVGVLYLGGVASGLAYSLYNASLRHLDASEVGVYTNLIPVVGVLTGVIMLGEPLSMRAIVGGAVVMLGVWVTGRAERSPATAPSMQP